MLLLLYVGDCPVPHINHGYLVSDIYGNANSMPHGQEIHYKCDNGYVPGADVPLCDNGTWTAEMICQPGINQIRIYPSTS